MVGDAHRRRLEDRRQLLQARLRRQAVSTAARACLPRLRAAGVRAAKVMPAAIAPLLAPFAAAPQQDERFDWSAIAGADRQRWSDAAKRLPLLRRALTHCTGWDVRLVVVWHPAEAGLRLAAADLMTHAGMILDQGREIWIVAATGAPWLIEVAAGDQEVCFALTMPEINGPAEAGPSHPHS